MIPAALNHVPKSNGAGLLALGVLTLGISVALYVGASRHQLGNSDRKNYDTTVKWTWGYGVGAVGVLCLIGGIYILITGR